MSSAPGWDEGAGLTAIVAAMDEELGPLRERLRGRTPVALQGDPRRVTLGLLGHTPVALMATGDGERNARRGLPALLAALPARRVLVVGIGGALSPGLGIASIVVGDCVVDERDGSVRRAPAALARAVERTCVGPRGVVVTAQRIADTPADKQRLAALAAFTNDPRSDVAAVVDLESAAFAAEAERAGVPWLVLRAVSDTSAEALPALLNRSRDDGGAVRRGRVALGLLSAPHALPRLLELRARVRICAGDLARAVEVTVAALEAAGPLAWSADDQVGPMGRSRLMP
jgi:adenosylhomocysteine nucleosidase